MLPLLTVCAVRLYHRSVQQRQALRAQWFDAALLTAGVIAAAAAAAALRLIGAAAHHLRYGLGNSALGSVVTVSSGGRVALRPLAVTGHQLGPGRWEAEQSWFDPRRHDATFAALPGTPPSPPVADLRTAFGPPARSYRVGPYTVLVWPHQNLLRHLGQVTARTRLWR